MRAAVKKEWEKKMKSVQFQYRGFVYTGKYIGKEGDRHVIQFPGLNEVGNLCARTFLITDKEFRRCNRG